MATLRQQKLAREIIKNASRETPLNKKELVVSSGYSEITAESSAHIILEQKGVQEELSALGFTEENAKAVTAQILLNPNERAGDRLKAAEMTFKVHGSFQPDESNDKVRTVNIFNNPTFEASTLAYEETLKQLLRNATPEPVQAKATDADYTEGIPNNIGAA